MNIFNLPADAILSFILTIMRVSIVMFMLPIFSSERVPMQVKAATTIVITLGIWPQLSLPGIALPSHALDIGLIFLNEIILGLLLGMCINFIFMGIQAGGELFGFQMGFTMISFADPLTGNQTGITAFFLWMVATLTFLALDGHLYMIQAFALTFKLIPAGGLVISELLLNEVLNLSAQLFIVAIKIASPIMASLFLIELALALVSRASPQINIMDVGFPVKIGAGFFFLGMMLVIMAEFMAMYLTQMDDMLVNILQIASPLGK